jgi:hypothetical protein
MSVFVDRMLLKLSDPAQVRDLLAPASDTTHARLRTLLAAAYDFPFAVLHDVLDVAVTSVELQRPLLPNRRTQGTLTQTIPGYIRTDAVYESRDTAAPLWLDLIAETRVTLLLEVDPGQVDSLQVSALAAFNTLDEFRAQFQFLDLDDFMVRHGLKTVEDLRDAFAYLKAEIHLRTLAPFDPADPANRFTYTLKVAGLLRDALDLAAALRDAKWARLALERGLSYSLAAGAAEVRTPYAPLLIFPDTTLAPPALAAATLEAFFAREGVLAAFVTLPA